MQSERREPSLHPMSNHPGAPASIVGGGGSNYGGSKYAASQQGGVGQSQVPSTPSLHPLTQHLQAHPPGSHRSSSRLGRMPPSYGVIPTTDDLIHATVRGRAISPTPSNPHGHLQNIHSAFAHHNQNTHHFHEYGGETPTQSRPQSPMDIMDAHEQQIVDDILVRTPRTSFTVTPSALAAEVHNSNFHDEDLCILLHAADDEYTHDVVKRAVRKAIRGRVKKLGLKHENEAVCPAFKSYILYVADLRFFSCATMRFMVAVCKVIGTTINSSSSSSSKLFPHKHRTALSSFLCIKITR